MWDLYTKFNIFFPIFRGGFAGLESIVGAHMFRLLSLGFLVKKQTITLCLRILWLGLYTHQHKSW